MKTTIDAMKQAKAALQDLIGEHYGDRQSVVSNFGRRAVSDLNEAIAREEEQTAEPITRSRYGSPELCELIMANLTKPTVKQSLSVERTSYITELRGAFIDVTLHATRANKIADMLAADAQKITTLKEWQTYSLNEIAKLETRIANPTVQTVEPVVWTEAMALNVLTHFGDGPYGADDVDDMCEMLSYIETLRPDLAQQVAVPQGFGELIRIAAWLLSPEPTRSIDALEENTHIGHRQFSAAQEAMREVLRLKATAIKEAADKLAAAPRPPQAERAPMTKDWLHDKWQDALQAAYRDDDLEAYEFFAIAIEERITGAKP